MTHWPATLDSDTFAFDWRSSHCAAENRIGCSGVVLYGMSLPMESWTDFAGALGGRTVITFDGPGVGASETPVVPYSMPMLADIAARVLGALGIENADVVGFSHGGAFAQQLAVGHPTRVNRLVLLPGDRGGEGHLHGQADVRAARGIADLYQCGYVATADPHPPSSGGPS